MLLKLVLVCSLLASPALASAGIKGHDAGLKGGLRSPIEKHNESNKWDQAASKTSAERHEQATKTLEHNWEQQAPQLPSKTIDREQKREEFHQEALLIETQHRDSDRGLIGQQKEEHHFEARPQIRLEAEQQQTKGGKLEETKTISQQREEHQQQAIKGDDHLEQQKLEQQRLELQKLEQQREDQLRLEQQKLDSQKLEQQRLEQHQDQQAVELIQNQNVYEQRQLQEDVQLLVQQKEETSGSIKGGSSIKAPIAMAEPYAFDYSVEGSSRRESGDTKGVVRGQYTLQGPDGSSRVVDYVADHNGFRATVNTNEFGTESRSLPGVEIRSSQPAAEDISLRLEGKTREFLQAPAAIKGGASLPAELEPIKRPDNWNIKQAPINLGAPAQPIVAAPLAPILVAAPQIAPLAEPRAISGKTIDEIRASQPASNKGNQKLETERADLVQQHQDKEQTILQHSDPIKAELRGPKLAQSAELKKVSEEPLRASGFESATASGRAVHHSASFNHQQRPQVGQLRSVIRPVLPVAPVHHRQQLPSRAQFQYDRYATYPRQGHNEPIPRLSFYNAGGSHSEYLDESSSSFEHPIGE